MNAATNNATKLNDGQARNLELLKTHKTVIYFDGKANRKGFHINHLCALEELGLVTCKVEDVEIPNYVAPHLRHNPKYAHLHCMIMTQRLTWTIA